MRRNYKKERETFIERMSKRHGVCWDGLTYLRDFPSLAACYRNGKRVDIVGDLLNYLKDDFPEGSRNWSVLNNADRAGRVARKKERYNKDAADLAAIKKHIPWNKLRQILVEVGYID